ncbi:MAG: M20 family metallopeptidase [Lentisphaerae bacterium]|nr:M20 family metallopeptidase [Lentisphaerota bacterium]
MKRSISSADLAMKMMAFRPASPDVAAVNKLVEFARGYLAGHGVFTRVERLKGRKVLWAATGPGRVQPLVFNAHLDVVPQDEASARIGVRGGWLYGRGSGDCLGNAAVLCNLLIACRGNARVGALFSTDEEIGGHTTALMLERGYAGSFIVVLDAGGLKPHLVIAQKGILTLRLSARGRSGHGSAPWKCDNALDRLIDGYLKIRTLFPPVRDGDTWHTTCAATQCDAGTHVYNRIPDRADMVLNIRWTDADTPGDIIRRIKAVSGLAVERIELSPMVGTDPDAAAIRMLRLHMARALRRPVSLIRMNGATDARHFAKLRVPVVATSIPYEGAHASIERASLSGMARYERILTDFARIFAPSGRAGQ